MRECPAIIAALPREVSALVKGWNRKQLPDHIVVYTNGHAVVACAGIGPARATLAVQAAMVARPVTTLLSVGLAGACSPELRAGDIVRAGVVIDSQTGERFENPGFADVLVTTEVIASVREKSRLLASYNASAVDMEAATVARLALAHGLEFQAIKAISDEAGFDVEGLSRFTTADGQFREVAFALHAALRPRMWSELIALAHNSSYALASLTAALESELNLYR